MPLDRRLHVICTECSWQAYRKSGTGPCHQCGAQMILWTSKSATQCRRIPSVTECDCGAPVEPSERGICSHCRYLDGDTDGEAAVIAALRIVGKAAPCELEELTGFCDMTIYRALKKLRAKGRVEFLGREVDLFDGGQWGKNAKGSSQVRHYYKLRSS